MDPRAALAPAPAKGPLAAVDPRVKVLCAAGAVVASAALPIARWPRLLALAALLVLAAAVGRVSVRWLAARLAFLVPLAAFLGLLVIFARVRGPDDGLYVALLGREISRAAAWASASIVAKSALCLLAASVLLGTTSAERVLVALSALRVPALFVALCALAFRYVFLLTDEMQRMVRAMRARGKTKGLRRTVRVLAAMTGALLVRSYMRSERVALAMVARGFSGKMPLGSLSPLRWRDVLGGVAVLAAIAAVALL